LLNSGNIDRPYKAIGVVFVKGASPALKKLWRRCLCLCTKLFYQGHRYCAAEPVLTTNLSEACHSITKMIPLNGGGWVGTEKHYRN